MLALLACTCALAEPQTLLNDAYATGPEFTVHGRVIEAPLLSPETLEDGKRTNTRRTMKRLRQREVPGVAVRLDLAGHRASAVTDDEGRFSVRLAPGELKPGWHTLSAEPELASGRVFVPHPNNTHVFVSDVDDTVLYSQVNHKKRLLYHSLMRNSLQREGFAGTADFYRRLSGINALPQYSPWFYLSASPRQLRDPLAAFLERQGFPEGVLLLKTFAWSGGDPWLDQKRYKLAALDHLLRDFSTQSFILIGDDGEHDPEIYAELERRYPGRVAVTLIRHVHPDARRVRHPGQCDLVSTMEKPHNCPALQALLPD